MHYDSGGGFLYLLKMEGWIKLHRKILDHWIYKNSNYVRAWIIILMTVNYEPKKVLIHGKLFDCERGQSLLSLDSWAKEFGQKWTKQQVRIFFDLLKNDSMILTEGLSKTTRLTVCNYDTYQDLQHIDDTQKTFKQHTDDIQKTPTKEVKKDKELKEFKEECEIKNESAKRFLRPSIEDVKNYCLERQNDVDPIKWISYYESNGWKVGRNPMKDWRAAVRTWEHNGFSKDKKSNNSYLKTAHDSSY